MNMSTTYYEAMKAHGFSNEATASVRKSFTCPRCGFVFSLVYARAFACQGCSEAVKGCPKVRCNKCDYEFFIRESTEIQNDLEQRFMSDHICKIVTKRREDQGVQNTR